MDSQPGAGCGQEWQSFAAIAPPRGRNTVNGANVALRGALVRKPQGRAMPGKGRRFGGGLFLCETARVTTPGVASTASALEDLLEIAVLRLGDLAAGKTLVEHVDRPLRS